MSEEITPPPVPAEQKALRGWQPIETAPMDGTRFTAANQFDAFAAYYDCDKEVWVAEDSGQWFGQLRYPPTHWIGMPPAPPAQHAAEEER